MGNPNGLAPVKRFTEHDREKVRRRGDLQRQHASRRGLAKDEGLQV